MDENTAYVRLVASVMLRGIIDHQDNVNQYGIEVAQSLEPAMWILDNHQNPFGYVWCCGILNISPDRLRMVMNRPELIRAAKQAFLSRP